MRVFIGLPLPADAVRALELVAAALKQRYRGLTVVKPQGFHITLFFLGETDEKRVDLLKDLIGSYAPVPRAIPARFSSIGTFPPRGNPRVLWAGLAEGAQAVSRLQAQLKDKLISLRVDLQDEGRPFHPHLTLARNKFEHPDSASLDSFKLPASSFVLGRLVLFQSILKPTGAEYHELSSRQFA